MGKFYYIAPEVLAGDDYSPQKADVFSFGCVMYFLASGKDSYKGQALNSISSNDRLNDIEIPNIYSDAYKTVMSLCL